MPLPVYKELVHTLESGGYQGRLDGWEAVRQWFAAHGVSPPLGPSIDVLRKWRQRHRLPVVPGTGKQEPFALMQCLAAWMTVHGKVFQVRRGEEEE